jgi:hypothetical protein
MIKYIDIRLEKIKEDFYINLGFCSRNHSGIKVAPEKFLEDIDFYETKVIEQIANAVYSDVYDYSLPSDLKGNKIIDIRPQTGRKSTDNAISTYGVEFDRHKRNQNFTIKDNKLVRTLRFNSGLSNQNVIHTADSITDNGTWTVGDDGANLTLDTQNYISGSGSLNFDTTGTGTTVSIQNTTLTAVDLQDLEDKGAFFVWVYMPAVTTNATLIWGDDLTTAYWSDTITTPQNGSFQVGWNLLRFDWNGATKTGTPDSSAISALKLSMTYDGSADTDYRVDNFVASLGEIYEIEYYSKYLFRTSGGTWQEETSDTSDIINLESEGYNVFLYKCLELVAPQIQAEDSGFDYQLYEKKYLEAKRRYLAKYKSEIIKPKTYYYRLESY